MKPINIRPFAAALCLATLAHAQVAPTSPPPSTTSTQQQEIIEMPAFEVSTTEDRGYQAVNSLAGGRTNIPLRLIPSAISAITAEFMEDLSITNVQDAYFWTLNASPGNLRQQETIFGEYSYNIRGVGSGDTVPTRNYFQFWAASDAYNTERFEFARGPNSIVYGDAQLGGQPTTFTKVPRVDSDFRNVRAQVDSEGGFRGTIDVNQRLGDRLSARLNGLVQRGEDWRDGIFNDRDAVTLAARYRFTDKTEVRAETEWHENKRQIYQVNHNDQASYWDGTTVFAGMGIPLDTIAQRQQAGVASFGGTMIQNQRIVGHQPHFVIIPGVPEAGFSDWGSFYQTTGTGAALMDVPRADIPNSPVLPSKEFTLQPPDTFSTNRFQTTTLWLDHRFTSNLEGQLSYYYYDDIQDSFNESINAYRVDVNTMMPTPTGLQPNPKFGVPFSQSTLGRQFQERTVNEVRALATLRLESDWGNLDLKQRFTVAGGRRWFNFDLITYYQRRVDPGPDGVVDVRRGENFVNYRFYWDEPRKYSITQEPNIPGVNIRWVPAFFTTHTDQVLDYGQFISNTTLWGERVSLLAGVRYDTFDKEQRDPTQLASGSALLPPVPSSGHDTTLTGGAVVYPLPTWRGIGVFINYSENFLPAPPGAPSFNGEPFGPTSGKGYDYGIRLNLFDGRVYASLSRYESEQTDRLLNAPLGPLREIWRGFGVPESDPRWNLLFRDRESLKAFGYEFEVTANPLPNFRLTAGYSLPETEIVERLADTRTYNAMHRAEWEAALANGTASNSTQLQNGLNDLDQQLLTSVSGATNSGTLKYSGHFYATYVFDDGPLDNVAIGAGGYYRGKEKIASLDPRIVFNTNNPTPEQRAASTFAYVYAPSYYNVTAHIAYEHRLFDKYRTRFQLNVDNLLDDDDPRFRGVNVHNVGGIPSNPLVMIPGGFNWPNPRKYTFTVSVNF